jgi:hypothetical protein
MHTSSLQSDVIDYEFGALSQEQKLAIADDGLVILPPSPAILDQLPALRETVDALLAEEGARAGWEGKEQHFAPGKPFEEGAHRLGNLVEKVPFAAELTVLPGLLEAAHCAIKSEMKIGAVLMREPHKGYGHQPLHIDWLPRERSDEPFGGVGGMLLLDDADVANGATRYVPGAHKRLGWPDTQIDVNVEHPDERRAEAPAGSVIVINLNLWHAGAINKTGQRRRTIFVDIRRRDLPQLLNQKRYLSARTLARLTPLQKYLLAVREEDPNQPQDSVGPGDRYREIFGATRNPPESDETAREL